MDSNAEMRMAGISGAGLGADLGAMDQEIEGDELAGDVGTDAGMPPETATGAGAPGGLGAAPGEINI